MADKIFSGTYAERGQEVSIFGMPSRTLTQFVVDPINDLALATYTLTVALFAVANYRSWLLADVTAPKYYFCFTP